MKERELAIKLHLYFPLKDNETEEQALARAFRTLARIDTEFKITHQVHEYEVLEL